MARASAAVPPALVQTVKGMMAVSYSASSWPLFRYFSKTISSLFTRKLGMLAPGWFLPSWNTSLVTHQWTKPLTFKAEAEW